MQLSDEIMANLSELAKQRTEASEADRQGQNNVTVAQKVQRGVTRVCGDDGNERDVCITRPECMVHRGGIDLFSDQPIRRLQVR